MSWTHRLTRRLRALFRPNGIDRELADEMRHHVALEAEEIARTEGVSADEARRRALVRFGGLARYQDEHRDARGIGWIEHTMRDLRHASRSLLHSPAFTISAVAVLALGIGSTTAVYSAVNSVLRNPAHDDLSIVFFRGFPSLSTVDYQAIAEQQRSFRAIGGMRIGGAAFRAGREASRVRLGRVTSGYFSVLGLTPEAGRLIEPRDEPVGADRVAVVSSALAANELGGAAAAIGRSVDIDGVPHTIVGVMPPPREQIASRADVWTALQLAPPERRGPFGMVVFGRLQPGATFESASQDLASISQRIFPLWTPGFNDSTARYEAVPIRQAVLGDSARMLRIFGVAVALVLIIGVANVASLMIVRAIGRSREVSLRAVLGASRGQLVRLFVAESALLSVLGAAAGIGLGALGIRALIALGPQLRGVEMASLDLRAASLAALLAVLAGLVVGAYPIVRLLRGDVADLSSGSRAVGVRGSHSVRSGFVVAQFALALPLLTISGLLLVSFMRLQRVDPGFDPANLLTVQISLPSGQYDTTTAVAGYWTRALSLVRDLPGVRSAGLGSSLLPNDFGNSNENFNLIDRPVPDGAPEPSSAWPFTDGDYFNTLGVRLLEGRTFVPSDTGAAPVVLVTRSWASKYYPNESPVGKTLIRGGCMECPPTTVIGVVDDIRYVGLAGPLDALHSPVTEYWPNTLILYVRTAGSPAELAGPVREALRSVDPTVPLDDIASMEERIYTDVAQPRQWATLLGGFAATALGLAAIGVFGMLSYMVGTRRREIGVRMALGAGRGRVVSSVVSNGILHAIIGSALGIAAALFATRSLANLLYEVSPGDPRAVALATVTLLGVAVIASWLPARRAAAIDPLEAIRHE